MDNVSTLVISAAGVEPISLCVGLIPDWDCWFSERFSNLLKMFKNINFKMAYIGMSPAEHNTICGIRFASDQIIQHNLDFKNKEPFYINLLSSWFQLKIMR